jgi:hypothetical protein
MRVVGPDSKVLIKQVTFAKIALSNYPGKRLVDYLTEHSRYYRGFKGKHSIVLQGRVKKDGY